MSKRTYTVSNVLGFKDTPSLKMTGKWLSEKGFNVGDKLEVIEGKNMIILAKIPMNELKQIEKRKVIKNLNKQLKSFNN